MTLTWELMLGVIGLFSNAVLFVSGGLLRYTVSEKDKQIQALHAVQVILATDIASLKTEVAVSREKHSTSETQMDKILSKLERIENFILGGRGSIHDSINGNK